MSLYYFYLSAKNSSHYLQVLYPKSSLINNIAVAHISLCMWLLFTISRFIYLFSISKVARIHNFIQNKWQHDNLKGSLSSFDFCFPQQQHVHKNTSADRTWYRDTTRTKILLCSSFCVFFCLFVFVCVFVCVCYTEQNKGSIIFFLYICSTNVSGHQTNF